MSQPFFDIQDVSFTYPESESGAAVINHLSLRIDEGEFVAIVGANGSGKTTFARHLNGLLMPTTGKVLAGGLDTRERNNWAAIHRLVGMVFQFPEDQIVSATVEEDAAFGPENLGLPAAVIRARVESALEAVGMWEHRTHSPHLLSAGQVQRLALAGALALHPKAVVFDEATTMLDPVGRRRTMELLRQLNREGTTIVFVTHFMEEAAEADRILVLDHGQLALDGSTQAVFSDMATLSRLGLELPGAARIAERLREDYPGLPGGVLDEAGLVHGLTSLIHFERGPIRQASPGARKAEGGIIQVEGLGHTYLAGTPLAYRALDAINLQVSERTCHGLAGSTGSGKSTLLQHLNGLLRPQQGTVRIGPYNLNDPKVTIKDIVQWVGLVFQNPEMSFFEYYVGDEIAYGPRQLLAERGGGKAAKAVQRTQIRERVREAMNLVGLDFEAYKDRQTSLLSGGERRKVALASILALKPRILALDEPTAGLDPASRRAIMGNLASLMQNGMTLVIASHQMEVLADLGGWITVLKHGRQALDGSVEAVFDQPEGLGEFNLEPPVAARVAYSLRQSGWPLPFGIMTEDGLATSLKAVKEAAHE